MKGKSINIGEERGKISCCFWKHGCACVGGSLGKWEDVESSVWWEGGVGLWEEVKKKERCWGGQLAGCDDKIGGGGGGSKRPSSCAPKREWGAKPKSREKRERGEEKFCGCLRRGGSRIHNPQEATTMETKE